MMPDAIYQLSRIFRTDGPEVAGCRQMAGNKLFSAVVAMLEELHGPLTLGAVSSTCGLLPVRKHSMAVLREVPDITDQTQNA